MLKTLRHLSERMGIERKKPPFDPSAFHDPVALQTSWAPLKGGGSNFRTHKLVQVDSDRMEIRTSLGALLFSGLFFTVGLGVLGLGVKLMFSNGEAIFQGVFMALFGMIFAGVGGFLFVYFSTPVVFDRRQEYFWKGRKSPAEVVNRSRLKYFSDFEEIHALQLISEHCTGDKSSYYSYELNLVLSSGSRMNVFDHGKLSAARSDAEKLAEFIGRPLWDAVLR